MEFQKHYRLSIVHLMDPSRVFERKYNRGGWPFLMLVDQSGQVVYKGVSDIPKITELLDRMLRERFEAKAIMREGVSYMPATLERSDEGKKARRREEFPSLACGPDGKVYVVFTTNHNGNSDVFIRVFDGEKWSEDKPIAATDADEFDGTIMVDRQSRAWISWTSNAGGRKYNIFVTSFTGLSEAIKPVRLTQARDDAMHGRMACDDKGRIWVTYYKWHRQGNKGKGASRDKEVYIRRLEGGKWSDEVQISPTDVPWYEDHSDPAITAYGDGAIVCWSWDFHQPKGYTKKAREPTVFMRKISGDLKPGKIITVSGEWIDVTPAIAVDNNRHIWCAWDGLGRRKTVFVRQVKSADKSVRTKTHELSRPMINVCTPDFAISPTGAVTLFWSENSKGKRWALKRAELDPKNNQWSRTKTVESKGNPRYCSGSYDAQGRLWISYSVETDRGREIVIRKLEKEKTTGGLERVDSKAVSDGLSNNSKAVKELRRAIDENYSYRGLRKIDWDSLFARYEPVMKRAKTVREFAEVAAKMLASTRDVHLWVKVGNETIGSFKRRIKRNYNLKVLEEIVPDWQERNGRVITGRFDDGIGYIMIKSWSRQKSDTMEAVFRALDDFNKAPGLIIDVRPNSGGAEPLARSLAGCFVQEPVVYAKHVYRDIDSSGGFSEVRERVLQPSKNRPKYSGKVVVLMGQSNMSSCEAFLLMMKQVRSCTLVGETSYGSSGNPKPFELGNGVTVWLPSWKAMRPDGTCFERDGIEPDVFVRTNDAQLHKRDLVLEAALKLLREH